MDKPITVTVQMDTTDPKKAIFTLAVSEEPISMHNYDGVEWTLGSAGWSFTTDHHGKSNGVRIKDAGDKFKDKKGMNNKHKWERVTADGQTYRYTISVTNDAYPDTVVAWDPSIVNN